MAEKFDTTRIAHKKLFVATPMYGGQCSGFYTKACLELQELCDVNDISITFYYLMNESLITRARNYCVDQFLRSDCTHMMFIDSDIDFNAQDVIKLLFMCDDCTGLDIVTGPYPKKVIAWEKVKRAVDQGYGTDNPAVLSEFAGDYAFNLVETTKTISIDNPVEIKEGGTGFMMIHRKVFEDYSEAYPQLKYKPDHVRHEDWNGDTQITAFFDCVIDEKSKRYLSEDYMFSQYARAIGKRIWMCPWMKINHLGMTAFKGNMAAIGAIRTTPTATKRKKRSTKNLTNLS